MVSRPSMPSKCMKYGLLIAYSRHFRTASDILSAVETALAAHNTKVVTTTGHSLGSAVDTPCDVFLSDCSDCCNCSDSATKHATKHGMDAVQAHRCKWPFRCFEMDIR